MNLSEGDIQKIGMWEKIKIQSETHISNLENNTITVNSYINIILNIFTYFLVTFVNCQYIHEIFSSSLCYNSDGIIDCIFQISAAFS